MTDIRIGLRIPCLNPRCRRTADAAKYAPAEEICCGKCFRSLPQCMRDRHRTLKRRDRRLQKRIAVRLARRDIQRSTIERLHDTLDRAFHENWQRIRNYFIAPVRPVGLDGFLQEIGL